MKKPQQVYATQLPNAAISFDVGAFNDAIRSQGVSFEHYRAMRCPVGLTDEYETRRTHEDHSGCSNGFIYTLAGTITCLFTGNGTQLAELGLGDMDGSTVQITLPQYYDDRPETPVYVAPYDRLYLAEKGIVVINWQAYRHDPSGWDKMNFPVVTVQDLMDSRGTRYYPGDYEVAESRIHWLTGKGPGVDPQTGRGVICSARYTYRPYWYVSRLLHEVRVSQAENPFTGAREVQRMPQACVLQREYIYEKNQRDDLAPDKGRQNNPPPEGPRFGPR